MIQKCDRCAPGDPPVMTIDGIRYCRNCFNRMMCGVPNPPQFTPDSDDGDSESSAEPPAAVAETAPRPWPAVLTIATAERMGGYAMECVAGEEVSVRDWMLRRAAEVSGCGWEVAHSEFRDGVGYIVRAISRVAG